MSEYDRETNTLRRTFVLLMILLVVTVAFAFVNLGKWSIAIAMTIAVVKGLAIVLDFMHLRHSPARIWLFASAGFVWLAVMLALTMSDYLTRRSSPNAQVIGPLGEERLEHR